MPLAGPTTNIQDVLSGLERQRVEHAIDEALGPLSVALVRLDADAEPLRV